MTLPRDLAADLVAAAQAFCAAMGAPPREEGLARAEALLETATALLLAGARGDRFDAELPVLDLPAPKPLTSAPLAPTDTMRRAKHACYVDEYGREDEVTAESLAALLDRVYAAISACLETPAPRWADTLGWHYSASECWGDELILSLRPLHELTRW